MECYVVVFFLFLLGFYFEHFFLEQLALSSSEMNRELIEKIIIIKKKRGQVNIYGATIRYCDGMIRK